MAEKKDLNKLWQERIQRAIAVRKEWAETFRVDMARDMFLGKQNPGYPEDEWITINKLYSHVMAQLPQLWAVNPYFYVKPKRSHQIAEMGDDQVAEKIALFTKKGKVRQGMLNYLKDELELRSKARLAILQAHFSYGAAKVRHAADERDHPKAGDPILDDDGEPMKDENGEDMLHPDKIPVNKRYELDWVSSDDILWDEDAGPLEDSWAWIAQRVRVGKDKALKNPRYNKSVIQQIAGRKEEPRKRRFTDILRSMVAGQKEKERETEILTFWEIYDLDERKWLTVAEDAKELIVKPAPLPTGIEKHPFSFLRFTPLDDSPYPYPPMSPGIDPQKEFCLVRSRMVTHRKRFNRKYTAIRAMLEDENEASKLESGEDGTVVFAQAHGAIEPIKDAPLDQQQYSEIAMLTNDLTELLGSPSQARGIADADSATEAGILESRQDIRESDRVSAVTDFALSIARKLDMLVQTHIEEDEAVKIVGPHGESWELIRAVDYEAIEGEFEYTVNAGASRPRLPDVERSQWIAFLSQVVIPLPHILTMPQTMKRVAEMFHIEDEAAIEEMRQMGQKILNQQVPAPGNTGGSQPAENNPAAAVIGQAMGALGGTNNGGGAP